DHDSLPQRLRLERALAVLGQDGLVALGLALLEHLHEAAEGEDADAVLRLFAPDAHDLGAEADREHDHLHAEDLREREVPRFVNEDQDADEQSEIEEIHDVSAAWSNAYARNSKCT